MKNGVINLKIAIMVPCYNEEQTIEKVIMDFKKELPESEIYVYDNNSKDKTFEIAKQNGAIVKKEYRQGKGNVVRSMFMDIDADIYVMVDGDDTYPAEFVHELIDPIITGEADMVIGDRLSNGTYKNENKRAFHNLGNFMVKTLINKLFSSNINDIMTGYRSFDRGFVKSMPVLSEGFEIETEISIHALDKRFLVREIPITYRDRPEGSFSKLNTFNDGLKVIRTIFTLFKDYKPLVFFSICALILFILGIAVGTPVIYEFIENKYITKLPSAVLAMGFVILSTLALSCALILDTVVKQNKRLYELHLIQMKNKEQS